jgi:hypothetical protein
LTKQQIESILDEVPDPPGVGKTAIAIAKRHTLDRIKAVLKEVKIVPVKDAFDEFKDELLKSFYFSLVEPGTAVGVTAGVSLGAPVTQLSLNSFHFAGTQSGVAMAFQKIRDLLTGSKMNRNPTMKIFLKKESIQYPGDNLHTTRHVGTFNQILGLKSEFEQTMVSDLVIEDGIRLLTYDESVVEGVPELLNLYSMIRPQRFADQDVRFPLTYVVQIQLDVYRMYTHRITMSMVAAAIEGPNPADALTVIWKSQLEGIIYILVDETRDYGQQAMTQSVAIQMYLQREVINKFGQWKISGLTGIYSIEPHEIRVFTGIHQITRSQSDPYRHKIYTSQYRTRWEGVSLADIHHLFKTAGFQVEEINVERMNFTVIYNPSDPSTIPRFSDVIDWVRNIPTDNQSDLHRRILGSNEISLMDAIQIIMEKSNKTPVPERTPQQSALIEASVYHYIKSDGANVDETVWRPDIDHFRTASNHSHEIAEMYGIDAALIFLIFSFRQTLIDFGSYVNSRHIALIFGLLCNLGMINSLTFAGINRRRIGALAAASSERSMDVFMNRSTFGDTEAIDGVSEAIYVGQKFKKVGTGSIPIEEDLSLIPQSRPTMPSIDEESTLQDVDVDEDFIDLQRGMELPSEKPPPPGPVDKSLIQRQAEIVDTPPPTDVSLLPPGAEVVQASSTLMSALEKVTASTPLDAEPMYDIPQVTNPSEVPPDGEIPDITMVDDIGGLALTAESPPERMSPASPPPTEGLIESLKALPTGGISIPEQPMSETENIVTEEAPLTPREEAPLTPTEEIRPITPPTTGGLIPLAPPPTLRYPTPPEPVVVPETPAVEMGETQRERARSPASFLDLFPEVEEVELPVSTRADVQQINIDEFLQ